MPRKIRRSESASSRSFRSSKKETILAPVRPNEGLEAAYRRKLDALIDEMHGSLVWWIRAAYRAKLPELAQDAPQGGGQQ